MLRSFSAVARQKFDPPSIPWKLPIEPAPGLDGPVRPPHPVRSTVRTAQAFLYTSTGAPGLGLPAHQEGLGGAGSTQAPNDCLSFTHTRIGFAHRLASLHTTRTRSDSASLSQLSVTHTRNGHHPGLCHTNRLRPPTLFVHVLPNSHSTRCGLRARSRMGQDQARAVAIGLHPTPHTCSAF